MLTRVLEPEAMDTEEEAREYDEMDHSEVNRRFVLDFLGARPPAGTVADLGTGTALIPIELCRQTPAHHVIAFDVAQWMLRRAAHNVARAGYERRVLLARANARRLPLASRSTPSVMSNSLIHHIPEPGEVLAEMLRILAPGGLLFVRDLMRPATEGELTQLVEQYAGTATPKQRAMFAASLRAALTVSEMRALCDRFGIPGSAVRATSDRHWTLCWRRP